MKVFELDNREKSQEILLSYKGINFLLANRACGQYSYERKVIIFTLDEKGKRELFKKVGVLKLFSKENIKAESLKDQCIIQGKTTFEECLNKSKEYIKKYVDFILTTY